MRDFDYLEPASLAEASRMLADLGDEARVLAGGSALVLALRQRLLSPTHLVSLGRIEALRGIHFDERQGLRIGALTLHAELARSAVVREKYPMLAEMAEHMANPQVRNQGTLGGNLCYADPATDPPCCLLALGAHVVLAGAGGERVLALEDFLIDYYCTALAPDELLTEVRVPAPVNGSSGRYARFLRTAAEHRPLVTVAVTVQRQAGAVSQARLVVGASTAVPTRVARAEGLLCGSVISADRIAETADAAADDIAAIDDLRGSEAHRRAMVRVVTRRALTALFMGEAR
ncbi:MAG: xanthine dehydrogenase family protein subunit M [Ideonella sp.]|nr:xanthine dehydrogenase family protein subunit M [Ideonella sp.]MBL0151724.1 xanthine dehydrogenase family protein subunit M [Ideonella sp.]